MEHENDRQALCETFRLIAGLFLTEPDVSIVKDLQDAMIIESSASLDEISYDFENLFFDPVDRLLPYESFYSEFEGELETPNSITESLYSAYLQEGLIMDENMNISPDHISAELYFISYLIETSRLASLHQFLDLHAVKWIPNFCDDLFENAKTDFYRELASITKDLVLNEYEELSS